MTEPRNPAARITPLSFRIFDLLSLINTGEKSLEIFVQCCKIYVDYTSTAYRRSCACARIFMPFDIEHECKVYTAVCVFVNGSVIDKCMDSAPTPMDHWRYAIGRSRMHSLAPHNCNLRLFFLCSHAYNNHNCC